MQGPMVDLWSREISHILKQEKIRQMIHGTNFLKDILNNWNNMSSKIHLSIFYNNDTKVT